MRMHLNSTPDDVARVINEQLRRSIVPSMDEKQSGGYVIRNGPVYYESAPSNWGRLHKAYVFATKQEAENTLQRLLDYSPGANHAHKSIEELPPNYAAR